MGLFGKNEKSTPSATLPHSDNALKQSSFASAPMAALERLLIENGITYSVKGIGEDGLPDFGDYRGQFLPLGRYVPYISIETTQLFLNPGCAMTYLWKHWREHPFATGEIGNIDVSVMDADNFAVSALAPIGSIENDTDLLQIETCIKDQISQGKGLIVESDYSSFYRNPYILSEFSPKNGAPLSADFIFSTIQLYAQEAHRIFANIVVSSGTPKSPPPSNVQYTPDAKDADGGYFVYGLDGFLWWLVDADFKFKSIVGEHVWKEQKEAEAGGLPLTAVDYDNLYRYEDGMVYDYDGKPVGRYYSERYDIRDDFVSIIASLERGTVKDMETGFQGECRIYRLFPEKPNMYECLQEVVEGVRQRGDMNLTAAISKVLREFADTLPNDERIQQLAKSV
jgi:hypothetical protein